MCNEGKQYADPTSRRSLTQLGLVNRDVSVYQPPHKATRYDTRPVFNVGHSEPVGSGKNSLYTELGLFTSPNERLSFGIASSGFLSARWQRVRQERNRKRKPPVFFSLKLGFYLTELQKHLNWR